MPNKILALLLVSVLLAPACYESYETRTTWADHPPALEGERHGRVEWIRETVRHTEGNPGAGAVAGAVVGGILGGVITGRGIGALFGAAGGAAVGAGASAGRSEYRSYDVAVRFDDGALRNFRYWGHPPFQPGQPVVYTDRGLLPGGTIVTPPAHAAMPPSQPPSAQPQPTPPPATQAPAPPEAQPQAEPSSAPAGEWVFTGEYGWLWMAYGDAYTFTPDYEYGDPYMYVYYPAVGWTWVVAPWLWGRGPMPYFVAGGGVKFVWHGCGWGEHWHGDRPAHYRYHEQAHHPS